MYINIYFLQVSSYKFLFLDYGAVRCILFIAGSSQSIFSDSSWSILVYTKSNVNYSGFSIIRLQSQRAKKILCMLILHYCASLSLLSTDPRSEYISSTISLRNSKFCRQHQSCYNRCPNNLAGKYMLVVIVKL
jgi:Pyruvate/2-oxoacid:ferredoxin oxidoreductase delta subunit